jgi:surface antigen
MITTPQSNTRRKLISGWMAVILVVAITVLPAAAQAARTTGHSPSSVVSGLHRTLNHRAERRSHRGHAQAPGRGGARCAVDGGGYCVGQCVDFVWLKRPDLSHLGNAAEWMHGAQARRIPTGGVPVVGAAAWWSGSSPYVDSSYGHVAYVISVGNNTVTFQEMNGPAGPGRVDTQTMALNSRYAPQGYIYGGPAGTGTTSPPAPPAPATIPTPSPTPTPQPVPTAPTLQPTPPAGPQYFVHHVTGACRDGACGLKLRSGPGYSSYAAVGSLPEGGEADIVCQAMGETVSNGYASSAIWDRLTSGAWISDFYVDTPNIGTWSPPIPQC